MPGRRAGRGGHEQRDRLIIHFIGEIPDVLIQMLQQTSGHLVVPLCDGKTQVEVTGYAPGETLDRETAQAVADTMMAQWRSMNPDATWVLAHNAPPAPAPPAPQKKPEPKKQDEVYGRYTDRDQFI